MPVGQKRYSGNLGAFGPTNPTALGTAALKVADKLGLGAKLPPPPKSTLEFDKAAAEAFGIPAGRPSKPVKQASKGRQNVPVSKSAPVKTAKAAAPSPRTPKRKPS